MGMSPCYSLMRGLMILLSILLFVVGVLVCGVSIWGVYYGGVGSTAGAAALWSVGAAGLVAAVGALLGALGAAGRRRGALVTAAVLGALLAAATAAAAVWAQQHHHELRTALYSNLRDHLTHHYGVMDLHTQLLDTIQDELQCCGVDGPRDWSSSVYSDQRQAAVGAIFDDHLGATGATGAIAAHSAALDLSVGAPSSYYYVPASCCNKLTELDCTTPLLVPLSSPPPSVSSLGCGPAVWAKLTSATAAVMYPAIAVLATIVIHALLAATLALSTRTHHRYKA